jgi:cytochrome c
MTLHRTLLAIFLVQTLVLAFGNPDQDKQEEGKNLFARRCSGCHATDINKEGPRLRGVYGRKAAALSDFIYSDSLKKLDLQWDEASLDRWLTNPEAMAPDTDMAFRLAAPDERKAVIAYLRSLGKLKSLGK